MVSKAEASICTVLDHAAAAISGFFGCKHHLAFPKIEHTLFGPRALISNWAFKSSATGEETIIDCGYATRPRSLIVYEGSPVHLHQLNIFHKSDPFLRHLNDTSSSDLL